MVRFSCRFSRRSVRLASHRCGWRLPSVVVKALVAQSITGQQLAIAVCFKPRGFSAWVREVWSTSHKDPAQKLDVPPHEVRQHGMNKNVTRRSRLAQLALAHLRSTRRSCRLQTRRRTTAPNIRSEKKKKLSPWLPTTGGVPPVLNQSASRGHDREPMI